MKSVAEEKVQPVFNLQVADGESFFVGRSGVLAHDNSTINPTPEPFDAVGVLSYCGGRPRRDPCSAAERWVIPGSPNHAVASGRLPRFDRSR